MTNIIQTLAVAATLMTITVTASNLALAGEDSFYPAHFKNSNLASPSVSVENAIPAPYRVGN
jgi:hypothetical protein